MCRALPYLRRAGDTVWEARSLTHRGEVFIGLGLPGRAAADFAHAEQLFATSGQEREYAIARHNLGLAALIRGDLPGALTCFGEAEKRYDALGENVPELAIDRCSALLAAGLAADAARETDTALGRTPREGGIAYKTAELLFAAATAALADEQHGRRDKSGHAMRGGCSGRRTGRSGRPAPTVSSLKPGTRPVSVPSAYSASRNAPLPISIHSGRTRRCGPTCWQAVLPSARAV